MDPIVELTRHVASLTTQLYAIQKHIDNTTSPTLSRYTNGYTSCPRLKLDVPHFNSSDTRWWIFKISQLFTYHQIPKEDRIIIASFYLDNVALSWYQ